MDEIIESYVERLYLGQEAGYREILTLLDERKKAIYKKRGNNFLLARLDEEIYQQRRKALIRNQALNRYSIKKEENLKQVTKILRDLHESQDFRMDNEFNMFRELEKYEDILRKDEGQFFDDYDEVREKVMALEDELKRCNRVFVPSHNDLVSENLVKDTEGRIYLIDWEYSGINDDMWDLAALSLENEFSDDDIELMFRLYFNGKEPDENSRRRLLIHQICQDTLWAVWTLIKEAEGDDFGTYGIDRYNRAKEYLKRL